MKTVYDVNVAIFVILDAKIIILEEKNGKSENRRNQSQSSEVWYVP